MIRPDNVLVWATFFPLIGAGIILVLTALGYAFKLPKSFMDQSARWVTLLFSALMLVASFLAWHWFDPSAPGLAIAGKATGVQMVSRAVWIRPFNVDWFVGVDGLSISMVLLTASSPSWPPSLPCPGGREGSTPRRWPAWTSTGTTMRITRSTSRSGWSQRTWCSCSFS
jgi:hypothetical protein